jgi:hypothetical protein
MTSVATLNAPGQTAVSRGGKYLTFALGKEEYGLEILKVREIIGYMDITAVPRTPPYVKGVVNLRGQVIAVVDLRTKFGMESAQRTDETCIIVVEIMGHRAGWLALGAGLSGGADVILIPEIPYRLEVVIEKIRLRNQRGAKFSIIVVAEGARPQGGEMLYQPERELGGAPRPGGIGNALGALLKEQAQLEVRVTVLGHLQRGGSPTAFDRLLGSRFGAEAVHRIAAGQWGMMVALQSGKIVAIPIPQAVAQQKLVPLQSDLISTAFSLDICLGEKRQNLPIPSEE